MTRTSLAALALAAALPLTALAREHDGDHRQAAEHHSHKAYSTAPARVVKSRRVAVPKPRPVKNPENIVRDARRMEYPKRDGAGATISKPAAVAPPSHHTSVARNAVVVRDIRAQQKTETVPNRHYWHESNGVRYSHYYDGHAHWYGFYHGPTFYWTRYHHDRWWWYDVAHARWVYWWDGFWWWPGPAGAAYVYVDNNYYPYQANGTVTVQTTEVQSPPPAAPAATAGNDTVSPDGKRMVQIVLSDQQAFLYDNTGIAPDYMKYLGRGVDKARWSGGTAGAPLQLLLEFKDGTFALYDGDGNPANATAVGAPSTTAGTPPEDPVSIPPPPTSAPGQ